MESQVTTPKDPKTLGLDLGGCQPADAATTTHLLQLPVEDCASRPVNADNPQSKLDEQARGIPNRSVEVILSSSEPSDKGRRNENSSWGQKHNSRRESTRSVWCHTLTACGHTGSVINCSSGIFRQWFRSGVVLDRSLAPVLDKLWTEWYGKFYR